MQDLLPSELLAVWKRKGVIWPRYAKPTTDNLETANGLIQAYKSSLGKRKRAVKDFVVRLEDMGFDYKFIRGLSLLLDRRSIFRCNSRIDPVDLRRRIFRAAAKAGLPALHEERRRIVNAVASGLQIDLQTVEESLYADLDSELVLVSFNLISSDELLKEYNLSLTQTLLFEATELNFTASGNWQNIFFAIKRSGLMYEAYQDGVVWVKIDGPSSLFKLTRRYGTSMAKLLPVIIANQEWNVKAKILWKYSNEICDFKIESWKHHALMKSYPAAVTYDSVVEENFAERFQALKSGWLLRREPEPVVTDRQVIIPDFSLEKEDVKVYVEIVGFWTIEYLLRKIQKLKRIDVNMLVLVNESLACERLAGLERHTRLNIIYYKDKIPLAPILRFLELAFQNVQARQTEFLKTLHIVFTEPIVDYEEFATRIGVSSEAVRAVLNENPPENYIAMPKSLVRKDKLEQIEQKIQEHHGLRHQIPFTEATRIVEAEGIQDVSSILKALGYKIAWRGISPENAEVFKPSTNEF